MTQTRSLWEHGIKIGVIGGVIALLIALVGMVESFNRRDIIAEIISMGHVLADCGDYDGIHCGKANHSHRAGDTLSQRRHWRYDHRRVFSSAGYCGQPD